MSSVLTDEKREEWRKLPPPSPQQQRQLREALNRQAEKIALAHAICGKYAFVRTSSEAFAARKAEEIALEDRPR
jgi:hypothetical protein